MRLVSTKAIVLTAIKYGDTSLIVKCFTEEEGLKTYMLKGVLKSKKGKIRPAYFQPLTQLQLTAKHSTKNTLHSVRDVQVINVYETIHLSVIKQSIIIFLSEVLSIVIKEEEQDTLLYNYIEIALVWLDTHGEVSNFHLLFLVNLSKYLGFYPDVSNQNKMAFNLMEGKFTDTIYEKLTITGNELYQFKKLLNISFEEVCKISLNKQERQIILRTILKYFELHLPTFKKPQSLDVLETIFN